MSETNTSTTGCTCPLAGYCERHGFVKHEIWHRNCATRPEWFQAYENGLRHEPAQGTQPATPRAPEEPISLEGIGDVLAEVFERTGVTWFVERAAKLAGLSGCGCAERQKLMNELMPFKPGGMGARMWQAVIGHAAKQLNDLGE